MADSIIRFQMEGVLGAREMTSAYDADLVEGLQAGAEEAYEQLIHRFEQPVYNLVHRLLNDPADSSDVVQDVFVKVFRNIDHFRRQSSLKTWIYRIALNEAYNHRRWFTRHRRHEVGLEAEVEGSQSLIDTIRDTSRDPYEVTLNGERHCVIEAALRDVNPKFRAAVVLRDLEEMSYEEIAEVMQVSLGTVKSRILRGRDALRRALLENGFEPSRPFRAQPGGLAEAK